MMGEDSYQRSHLTPENNIMIWKWIVSGMLNIGIDASD